MRVLIFFILILFYLFPHKPLIISGKSLSVSGETSIGGFTCEYQDMDFKDTLLFKPLGVNNELIFDIPVREFSCGNFLLNRDFRKTIKADQYPEAVIKVRNIRQKDGNYICDLQVKLAGKNLAYQNVLLQKEQNKLQGNLIMSFEELDLEAPHRMGGLIKVKERLSLHFSLGIVE